MKRVPLIAAGVLLLLGAAVGAAVSGHLGRWPAQEVKRLLRPAPPRPVLVSVPAITTNLGGVAEDHFAEVAMTVQLADAPLARLFAQRQAAVDNAIIADLRGESFSALGGVGGMNALRQLIVASLDRVLGQPHAVQAVFFTQFVVQ